MFASYHLAFLAVNSALQERIVPKEEIATFFQQYKKLIKEVNPAFIFNMDESFVSPNTKEKVVVSRTTRGVTKEEKVPCHLTLVGCVCADNTAMKPLIILDIKTAPPAFLTHDLLSKAFISGSETGWMNGEIYSSWVKDCFSPCPSHPWREIPEPVGVGMGVVQRSSHCKQFPKSQVAV